MNKHDYIKNIIKEWDTNLILTTYTKINNIHNVPSVNYQNIIDKMVDTISQYYIEYGELEPWLPNINNYLKDNFIEDYFTPDNEISFNNKSEFKEYMSDIYAAVDNISLEDSFNLLMDDWDLLYNKIIQFIDE